jgi:hypothetical protein
MSILSWKDRPDSVREAGDSAFESLRHSTISNWSTFNGVHEYSLCGVGEHQLFKTLIQRAYPNQKSFVALDIGAANFEWVETLHQFLEKQTDLPEDIEVHIIGVRAEK